ncbi:response regulator [Duganella violaceipulchra]|uniref:DNA-binding NarL/FixJ family response regulator n=1 Tax=Duganella violaceipulchra TaxID=2849652 RepID=A0AA41H8U3_9BURK|nr:response regulator transcription factor [Duganella violaceicalia]MBV6320402.1 response regulator transcription factor [Duganella violaceicalia]MCP2012236.1 DNA-binding NarL/FixJ family response regulator [Duganella violaceicalia]
MDILLADDHAIFRQGLKLLLQSQEGMRVVAEAASLEQVQPALQQQAIDLLILDYHMPGGESSAMLGYCKQRYPKLKVIALTGSQSGIVLKQLRDARADAVLQKDCSGPDLLRCIAQVMDGRTVLSDSVQQQIASCDELLTARELQTVQLIYQGYASIDVASRLNLSAKTVDKHRENVMRKLQVHNVVQLIHKVRELKLV